MPSGVVAILAQTAGVASFNLTLAVFVVLPLAISPGRMYLQPHLLCGDRARNMKPLRLNRRFNVLGDWAPAAACLVL